MNNVRCWNCGMDFEHVSSAADTNKHPTHIPAMPDAGTTDGINGHDIYCKSYYPHLLDNEVCTWCAVIRRVRRDYE